jgi:hypothetical protein
LRARFAVDDNVRFGLTVDADDLPGCHCAFTPVGDEALVV